ncbi:MAG: hypothetical protein ACQEWV_12730 [Bacillota bacterium]
MKEFSICYTLDAEVKWEEITGKSDTKAEEILQQVLQRVTNSKVYTVKNNNEEQIINTSSIRYVRIFEKNSYDIA